MFFCLDLIHWMSWSGCACQLAGLKENSLNERNGSITSNNPDAFFKQRDSSLENCEESCMLKYFYKL